MDDIITGVVSALIISALTFVAATLRQQLKSARASLQDDRKRAREHDELMEYMRGRKEHDRLVDEALRTLLLRDLETQQDHMVHVNHGVADNDAKLRAQRVYDTYHKLGGNGHGTAINQDIQQAPIAPKP